MNSVIVQGVPVEARPVTLGMLADEADALALLVGAIDTDGKVRDVAGLVLALKHLPRLVCTFTTLELGQARELSVTEAPSVLGLIVEANAGLLAGVIAPGKPLA